jgi:hypothetical protein
MPWLSIAQFDAALNHLHDWRILDFQNGPSCIKRKTGFILAGLASTGNDTYALNMYMGCGIAGICTSGKGISTFVPSASSYPCGFRDRGAGSPGVSSFPCGFQGCGASSMVAGIDLSGVGAIEGRGRTAPIPAPIRIALVRVMPTNVGKVRIFIECDILELHPLFTQNQGYEYSRWRSGAQMVCGGSSTVRLHQLI